MTHTSTFHHPHRATAGVSSVPGRSRRIALAIIVAALLLGFNAVAVIKGVSPFQPPGSGPADHSARLHPVGR